MRNVRFAHSWTWCQNLGCIHNLAWIRVDTAPHGAVLAFRLLILFAERSTDKLRVLATRDVEFWSSLLFCLILTWTSPICFVLIECVVCDVVAKNSIGTNRLTVTRSGVLTRVRPVNSNLTRISQVTSDSCICWRLFWFLMSVSPQNVLQSLMTRLFRVILLILRLSSLLFMLCFSVSLVKRRRLYIFLIKSRIVRKIIHLALLYLGTSWVQKRIQYIILVILSLVAHIFV